MFVFVHLGLTWTRLDQFLRWISKDNYKQKQRNLNNWQKDKWSDCFIAKKPRFKQQTRGQQYLFKQKLDGACDKLD